MIDMRGHGDSAWDRKGSYVVEDYVKDIAALIAQLKLRNIVLWGNSTGGRVAQMIAGQSPDLVTAVIVEDVGPERPREVSNRRADRMGKEADGWATADDMLVQVKKENPRTPESVLKELVRYGSKPRADGRIVWKRDPAILNGFQRRLNCLGDRGESRSKRGCIYILGGVSTIVPVETQAEIKAALPQAQIVTHARGSVTIRADEQPMARFYWLSIVIVSSRQSPESKVRRHLPPSQSPLAC